MERKRKLEVMPESEVPNGQQKPTMNPHNGKLYSQRFHDILEKRQGTFVAQPHRAWRSPPVCM